MPYTISDDNLHGDIEFLFRHFERADGGWKAYKIFGSYYTPDESWVIAAGSTITTELDLDEDDDCSWGINVAEDTEWLTTFESRYFTVWEMLIPDGSTIVIPWGTDGKIRTDMAVIVRDIGFIEGGEFVPTFN